MAQLYPMSDEQKQIWADWVAERPPVIKALCERFQPNHLYRNKVTNRYVIPRAFYEDNTLLVFVPRSINGSIFPSVEVFDVPADNLEEVELPNGMKEMTFEQFEQMLNSY